MLSMVFVLGADGLQETVALEDGACCPDLCPDLCSMICSFVQLLPNGPMWDRRKAEVMSFYKQGNAQNVCEVTCPAPPPPCHSVVDYAAYLGRVTYYAINTAVWPALRESEPETSVTNLDDWLVRLGWEDCFGALCRSTLFGQISPFSVMTDCGPVQCDIPTPIPLQCALKHNIVRSLVRLQSAGVKNMDVINWIIEPLDSIIEPRHDASQDQPCCKKIEITIRPINKFVQACPPEQCGITTQSTVSAVLRPNDATACGTFFAGLPEEIYPATVAAECIVRSILKSNCPNVLFRGC